MKDLFPNMIFDIAIDLTNTEDSQAGYAGVPFTQPTHEEEWVEWVDWAEVAEQ